MDKLRKIFSGDGVKEEKEHHLSGFTVYKASDGYRWIGWATNKWEDREGEILTDSAHKEFLNYLNENPDKAPELWVWHIPQTARKNKADFWEYTNGFFIYSGLLTEEEAMPYLNKKLKGRVGMSHGFWVLEKEGRFIKKYRTFEVSELPHARAANAYTDFEILMEEKDTMFSDEKRAFLVERFGEEKVTALESDAEGREKMLTELGVTWKELSEEYETHLATKQAEAEAKAAQKIADMTLERVMKAFNVDGLQETFKEVANQLATVNSRLEEVEKENAELKEAVEHLLKTDDEKLAKAFATPEPVQWQFSVTKEDTGEVDVEEAVAEAKDAYGWLSFLKEGE